MSKERDLLRAAQAAMGQASEHPIFGVVQLPNGTLQMKLAPGMPPSQILMALAQPLEQLPLMAVREVLQAERDRSGLVVAPATALPPNGEG